MATLMLTDGTILTVAPKSGKKFKLKEAQDFVKGFVELVYFPDNTMLIVNEEGIIKDLPYNHVATEVVKSYFGDNVQKFYGDILWCNQNEF